MNPLDLTDSGSPAGGSRRREARQPADGGAGRVPCLRGADGRERGVLALRNVSSGGASVLLEGAQAAPAQAALVVEVRGARLAFEARVVWQRPASEADLADAGAPAEAGRVIGLQVLGPGSLAAMLVG